MAQDGLVPSTDEGKLKLPFGKQKNPNARFEQFFHRAKTARLPFDKELWLNVMFFLGQQYVEWGDTTNALRAIDRPANVQHIPRPVANKIQHYVLDAQADVLQTRPMVDVLPASDDPADISISQVCKAYLTWLGDDTVADWQGELAMATLWALAGTEAYIKNVWDQRLNRGDYVACSPLDVYGDPYARTFDKSRYVFHRLFMDVEQVYDIYGIEVPATAMEHVDPVRVAIQREMGMAPVLQGAFVTELWMPPNRRHPEGLFRVWSGHTVLIESQAYPYDHHQIPFQQIGSIPRPGTPHYTSVVSALRNPQMELNKFHAQMIAIREAYASPKWWIDNALDLESDPDDSPRQILKGNSNNGTLKPELIMPAPMPLNAQDAGNWIENEMMDTAGYHEVPQGQAPGRVDSAKGLELLKEQDMRQAEMLRTIKRCISCSNWQQLQLAKQFGSEKMVFETYSREGFPETHQMMTTKLSPGIRVRVTWSTGLAQSRAAREDQLMNMWGQGIISDREQMAELLDLPVSSVSPDNAFDIKCARNENFIMADGTFVTANSWDNHDIHRREHNNYRKTVDYLQLSDNEKQMFEAHVELHDQLEIQQLGKQLQIQQMAAGVAAGAGFQQPEPPGPLDANTPGVPGGAEQGAGPGQPTPTGTGGTQPPRTGGPPQIPNAAGASTPTDPFALRDSAQGQATLRDRYRNELGKG